MLDASERDPVIFNRAVKDDSEFTVSVPCPSGCRKSVIDNKGLVSGCGRVSYLGRCDTSGQGRVCLVERRPVSADPALVNVIIINPVAC